MTNADVVGTSNIWPYYAKGNLPPNGKKDGNELGKDQFLHILITQLRHQDPMQPMQDREFIAQMAQFSTVEQVMNMATELKQLRNSLGHASSLIGQTITWTVYDAQGQPNGVESGTVDAILMKDGVQYAKSGVHEIPMDDIVRIGAVEPEAEEPGAPAEPEGSA